MNIKKQVLSPPEVAKRIKHLEALIMTEFHTTPTEAKEIILRNKDLIHVDTANLSQTISLLSDKYGLKEHQIKQIFFNSPIIFFDPNEIIDKETYFQEKLGLTTTQYAFALMNNPNVIKHPKESLDGIINLYTKEAKLSDYFIKNILTRTIYFCNTKQFIQELKTKIAILTELGIPYEEIAQNPSICANKMQPFLRKIKIAKLSGFDMLKYIDSKYMTSDAKMYARYKAQEMGIIDVPTIYIKESDLVNLTDFTTEDLMKTFPFNGEAQTALDADFKEKFPELDQRINALLEASEKNTTSQTDDDSTTSSKRDIKNNIIKAFGIASMPSNSSIFMNSIESMLFKLQLAKLDGISMDKYANGSFMCSETKAYARYMLQLSGRTQLPTIYISEQSYISETGFNAKQIQEMYPLTDEAKKFIEDRFEHTFPEIAQELKYIFNPTLEKEIKRSLPTISETNEATPQVQLEKTEQVHEQKEALSYKLKRFMRITQLSHDEVLSLGDTLTKRKHITEKDLNAIALNFTTLRDFGFSKDEIISHPLALLVNQDKLILRLKLAKIHERTNKQFLTSDFKASEETVFVRTCGVKIMKLAGSSLVYETEAKFSKLFGATTNELRRFCRLDQNGLDLIENMYAKVQQNGDESEQ